MSKREPSVSNSKKGKSKPPVIVLHDSPVRGASPTSIAPVVEAIMPSPLSTVGVALSVSPDPEAKKHKNYCPQDENC